MRRDAAALCGVLALVLMLVGATAAGGAAAPAALTCPAGQTTWLRGSSTPGSALLAHFDGVPVGGGSTGADGAWAIPLTVREQAGVYPVAVTNRQDGSLVAAFTCYVDVPLGATPTTTATPLPTLLRAFPSATSTPASAQTATQTTAPAATTPVTLDRTSTPQPAMTDVTAEPAPAAPQPEDSHAIVLAIIQADDPAEPGLFEYAILENVSPVPHTLSGWRLINQATGEAYAIPDVTLPAGELLVIWSGAGADDPTTGTLYWPAPQARWRPGHTAALASAEGKTVSTLVVGSPPQAAVGEQRCREGVV